MVARAAMLLECAHLVSRCNHGDWPRWMKMPGGVPHSRSQPTGYRRNLLLQRTSGRLFHQWAEVSFSAVSIRRVLGGFEPTLKIRKKPQKLVHHRHVMFYAELSLSLLCTVKCVKVLLQLRIVVGLHPPSSFMGSLQHSPRIERERK